MKKPLCTFFLLLCILTLAAAVPAGAEIRPLSVVVTGLLPGPDGTLRETEVEGRFRVFSNGEEIGEIAAGEETISVNTTDRIRLEPVPESFDPSWDLTPAYFSPDLSSSRTVFWPVTLSVRTAEEPEVTEESGTEESSEANSPADAPDAAPEQPGTEEIPAQGGAEEDAEENAQPQETDPAELPAEGSAVTPTIPPYTPADQPTPEPQLPGVPDAAEGGTFRLQVFHDKNGNGSQGSFEDGVSAIPVYLLNEEGEALLRTETDASGFAVFEHLPAGMYAARILLPEQWYFTAYAGEGEISLSAFEACASGQQTGPEAEILPGAETLQGAGIRNTAASMGGFCWLEDTADGLYKAEEPMLPGIRIRLALQDSDLVWETETDAEGRWQLTNLRPGFYTLSASAPDGLMPAHYTQNRGVRSYLTQDNPRRRLEVSAGAQIDANIGFAWAARISGRCYLDANYNGIYDEGELPLPGVKLTVKFSYDGAEASAAVSGEDGTFVLDGLRGNNYMVQALLPAGGYVFTRTAPEDSLGNRFTGRGDGRSATLQNYILADAQQTEMNIGAILPASVSGMVYLDDDFSATRDAGEKTVSGFSVTLLDAAGNAAGSARTNAAGAFEIVGLVPGEYSLSVNALPGYAFTRAGEGNVVLNRTGGEGYSDPFRVDLGAAVSGMQIGMIRPATVQGNVFADRNDNGLQDSGENGLAGTVVRLVSETEGETFRAEIGESGAFVFDAVMPGRYVLEYILPERGVFARGMDALQPTNAEGTARTAAFDVASGDSLEAPLCGALTLGTISGTAFRDPDGNGIPQGEQPLEGLRLRLIPSRSGEEELSCVSNASGTFAMTGIRPDLYTLEVICPDGLVLSRTDALSLPLAAGAETQAVPLPVAMGQEWTAQAIGAASPASVRGRVWLDENSDGHFTEGERTPQGLTLLVTDEITGALFAQIRTDAEGYFSAEGLIPGSYTVSFPLDAKTVAPPAGDSDFLEKSGALVLSGISLREGEAREGLLLGIVRFADLSGHAWIDRGGQTEALSGMAVSLLDEEGKVLASAVSDASGAWRMERLLPCRFHLAFTAPEGCVLIEPGDPRLQGGLRSAASETLNRSGSSVEMELLMGEDLADLDVGCVLPGRLGDLCWLDLNGDGLQAGDEPGLSGVRIELLRGGVSIAETQTNAYGFWRFVDLYPAEYTVRVYAPAEVAPTRRRAELPMIASVLEEKTDPEENVFLSVPLTVESDRENYDADLGFICRKEGVLPAGAGEAPAQIWMPKY